MTKLEVFQWQFDEIESCVWATPGGPAWVEENLTLIRNKNIFRLYEVLYVFFGPLARMLQWKRQVENDLGEYDAVIHAYEHHKLQGRRAKPKRVYDLDGDKHWYWMNYTDSRVRATLEETYQLASRYGMAE